MPRNRILAMGAVMPDDFPPPPCGENSAPDAANWALSAAERRLLAGFQGRIRRSFLLLGALGTVFAFTIRGWGWGLGFAVGAALSALNFFWLSSAVATLSRIAVAARAADPGATGASPRPPRPARAAARFVLRYALIAAAGYAIFRSSALSLAGFFVGLFVAVGAIFIEIGYELYTSFRNPRL